MRIQLTFIFLLICMQALTQKRESYFPLGIGWAQQHVRDNGMSPLIYKGSSVGFKTGYLLSTPKKRHSLDLLFHYGKLHTRNYKLTEETQVPAFRLDLSYTYLRELMQFGANKYKLFLGGRSELLTNLRLNYKLGNSAANYEVIVAMGITTGLNRAFDIRDRKLIFDLYFNLPFLSYMARPNYITITDFSDPDNEPGKEHFDRATFNTFNKFTQATIEIDASYPLKNGNMIRLSYYWDFYSYRRPNKLKAAIQGLVLSTVFNF